MKINKEKCLGCGYCVSTCPEVFELGDDGKSEIKKGVDLKKHTDCLKEAKQGCPAGAIEE